MTFEEFRQWALDTSRGAARRWEEPHDDEFQVLLGQDDYGAFHTVPVPPLYLQLDRGHVHWLKGCLADLVASRSLKRIAFRTSAWASTNPKYEERPVDDPKRTERLQLAIAENGRFELWFAAMTRSRADVPGLGKWELFAKDDEVTGGAIPKHMRKALESRPAWRGPTMPAADLVLGPWDVEHDLVPLHSACGPLPNPTGTATSSYRALFRPESPGPVLMSQAITSDDTDAPADYMAGSIRVIDDRDPEELEGPAFGEEARYFRSTLDGRLKILEALWRYPGILCQVSVSSPSGRFKVSDLRHYAALQDKRARAALASV